MSSPQELAPIQDELLLLLKARVPATPEGGVMALSIALGTAYRLARALDASAGNFVGARGPDQRFLEACFGTVSHMTKIHDATLAPKPGVILSDEGHA